MVYAKALGVPHGMPVKTEHRSFSPHTEQGTKRGEGISANGRELKIDLAGVDPWLSVVVHAAVAPFVVVWQDKPWVRPLHVVEGIFCSAQIAQRHLAN